MDRPSALLPDADSLFVDTPIPDDGPMRSADEVLWLAVVAAAWVDAFNRSDIGLKNTDRVCSPEVVRGEARRWLTLNYGSWKVDRETVCIIAGIDPDMLRGAARRRLQEIKTGGRTAQVVSLDTMFTELLDRADGMDSVDIDAALIALAELEVEAA